jgi:glycosyl transferase family 25
MFPDNVFTRICHVKTGYEDREHHIRKEFGQRGVPVNYFTEWDRSDITDDVRASMLGSDDVTPSMLSLALKHIGIWREFLKTDKPYCLVFEDDVFLAKDFVAKLNVCLAELGSQNRKAVVYLGNGSNYYIARKNLKKGQTLYPAKHARCADSYLITRPVAEARCRWFDENKIPLPIDHLIEQIDPTLGIEILWFERPIVEQGSENGAFASSVNGKKQPLWVKRLKWNFKKYRRQYFGHTAR